MDHVELRQLRVAYQRPGEGPPVVLLRGGFGFDSRSWRWQSTRSRTSSRRRLGRTGIRSIVGSAPATFRLPDYADCLVDFITALDLISPHIVGFSSGAALALESYRRHPSVPGRWC
jgi:pimeloyl-ACP methyl ester carboxylesterase